MVEKASSLKLNDCCHKHIFAPLNVKNISYVLDAKMKSKLACLHFRAPETGDLAVAAHQELDPEPGSVKEAESTHYGGHGLWGQPTECAKSLGMLLGNGTCPITTAQLLKAETVDEIFTNQIPSMPDFGRTMEWEAVFANLTNPTRDIYPEKGNPPQDHGLGFMMTLSEGDTGRGPNTGMWGGLPNLRWRCDRERGVAGITVTQIFPFWGKLPV